MTKAVSAVERGLKPHYKVRIVLPGAILHLASKDEPMCVDHDIMRWTTELDRRTGMSATPSGYINLGGGHRGYLAVG